MNKAVEGSSPEDGQSPEMLIQNINNGSPNAESLSENGYESNEDGKTSDQQ